MPWEFETIAGPYGGTTEGPAWDGEVSQHDLRHHPSP